MRVLATRFQSLRKVDEDRAGIALVPESNPTQKNLVDLKRRVQIQLDAAAVFEHPEANRVLALKKLLLRINTYVEVIKQQIVICAIRSVRPAQKVGACCPVHGNHGCGEYQKYGETAERK